MCCLLRSRAPAGAGCRCYSTSCAYFLLCCCGEPVAINSDRSDRPTRVIQSHLRSFFVCLLLFFSLEGPDGLTVWGEKTRLEKQRSLCVTAEIRKAKPYKGGSRDPPTDGERGGGWGLREPLTGLLNAKPTWNGAERRRGGSCGDSPRRMIFKPTPAPPVCLTDFPH